MFTLPSAFAWSESSTDIAVVLESGMGRHESTPNRTIIFVLNVYYRVNKFNGPRYPKVGKIIEDVRRWPADDR